MGGIYDEHIKIDLGYTTVKTEVLTDDDCINDDDNDDDYKPVNDDDYKPEFINDDNDVDNHVSFDDGDSDMEEDLPAENDDTKEDVNKSKSLRRKKKTGNGQNKKRIRKYTPSRNLPVHCEICGMRIIGTTALYSHKRRVHFKEKNYKCLICSKAFFHNSGLQGHLLTVHTRQCQSCNTYVNESEPWKDGMTSKSIRSVKCECGNDVIIKRTAIRRTEMEKSKPKVKYSYACEYCGKIFYRKSHCTRHAKLHTDRKPNAHCYVCGETFKFKKQLKNHRAEVHNLNDFQCKFCPQFFPTKYELEEHLVLHPEHEEGEDTESVIVMSTHIDGNEIATVTTNTSGTSHDTDPYSKLVNDVIQQFGDDVSSIIIKNIDA